jgi:hypothetical protein
MTDRRRAVLDGRAAVMRAAARRREGDPDLAAWLSALAELRAARRELACAQRTVALQELRCDCFRARVASRPGA